MSTTTFTCNIDNEVFDDESQLQEHMKTFHVQQTEVKEAGEEK